MPVLGSRWHQNHHHQWSDAAVIAMVGSVIDGFGVASRTVIKAAGFLGISLF
jgi:hypothetical protein